MNVPFMRAYALAAQDLPQARRAGDRRHERCRSRTIRKRTTRPWAACARQARDADGYDGGWVAHPGLVPIAMEEFVKVLGDKPNQIGKQRRRQRDGKGPARLPPEAPITEAGLRNNINVGIHYLGAWLAGNGCVPIHNLMEDAPPPKSRARRCGSGSARRRASSTTAARSPPNWCAMIPGTGQGEGRGRRRYEAVRARRADLRTDVDVGRFRRIPDAAAVRGNLIGFARRWMR
jgi:hypothetical protein